MYPHPVPESSWIAPRYRDYYGVNGMEGDTFEEDVKEFLKEKMDKN